MNRIVIATKNAGKLAEVRAALQSLPYEMASLDDYPDVPDVQENGRTFVDNAVQKAGFYCRWLRQLALADDSGLEVEALGGRPGVFSSRFAPTDEERIARLLAMMKDVPDASRAARFICVIALAWPDGAIKTCEGTVEGIITREPRGDRGFGYDPIFLLPELGITMAELERDEKNRVSHRGKALAEARALLAV